MNTVVNFPDPSAFDARQLAEQLAAASRTSTPVAASSLAEPATLDAAIAVQMLSLAAAGLAETVWKVAATPAGDGVRAPMFPLIDQAVLASDFAFRPGLRLEVEIALRLGQDVPVRSHAAYTREHLMAAVGQVFLGIEVLEKRMSGTPSYLLRYADRLDNGGYVIGPALPLALIDTVGGMPLRVTIAGQTIFEAAAAHPKADVLAWLLAYANNPDRPSDSLLAGEFITTGTLCGAVDLPAAGTLECQLDDAWTMDVTFV